ncbi:Alb1-domain-containing protein [Hypoxylon fuscum]|nr:Alb1-domain-containing protein [Hypoxylon fuscum]
MYIHVPTICILLCIFATNKQNKQNTAIMAKGAIAKKKKAPSLHSRAARRATSPGIDTDKSLKNVQPPAESVDHRPSILSIHQGAGVSKKTNKGRNMSTKARKRHEKDQDRGAAILERTEKKMAKSKGQARTIQSRRKAWDDINTHIPKTQRKPLDPSEEEKEEVSELDEVMDYAVAEKSSEETVPLQEVKEEEEEKDELDEIL